ncbi:MAG: hypothetical protein ACPL28_02955 [bacterium]
MRRILLLMLILGTFVFGQKSDSLCDSSGYKQNLSKEIKTGDAWLSQDKFLHFSACASMVGLSYHTLVCRLNKNENQGKVYSISFTALIGLGKEIYDKKKKGHFSWKDLCWDGAGMAAGYFAFIHRY